MVAPSRVRGLKLAMKPKQKSKAVAPSRVRGLKLILRGATMDVYVAPSRVRGLKQQSCHKAIGKGSRTFTGAWIETLWFFV